MESAKVWREKIVGYAFGVTKGERGDTVVFAQPVSMGRGGDCNVAVFPAGTTVLGVIPAGQEESEVFGQVGVRKISLGYEFPYDGCRAPGWAIEAYKEAKEEIEGVNADDK